MSRNIKLIEMTEENLELVRSWRNSTEISKYMYTDQTISKDEQLNWFNNIIKDNPSHEYKMIVEEEENIGLLYITNIDLKNSRCTWGFYLSPDYPKGKGIGSYVEYLVVEYIFNELKLSKICCEVLDFNKPVMKLHSKFGFKEEGILKKHIYKNNEYLDVHVFGLFPNDWEEKKAFIKKLLKID